MASPFTEMEGYAMLFCLLVFSLFTLHGLIQERCSRTTGFELVFTMGSPFTEMESYTILFCLLVFGLITLHGMIQELYTLATGFELVFIFIAFTIMCLFGLAAVYTRNTEHQDDYIQTEQKITKQKSSKKKLRLLTKTSQELP